MTIEAQDAIYFCGVDFSQLRHGGRTLFDTEDMEQLQLDFSDPVRRTTSWSNWDERVPKHA